MVDNADQGITHIVRGEDLADNTARQIGLHQALYSALVLPLPQYLHVPLVLAADGQKLSKQNGAQALDIANPQAELQRAAARLGLAAHTAPPNTTFATMPELLQLWTQEWRVLSSAQLN